MNIEEVKAIKDPVERAKVASEFIDRGEAALTEARQVRDAAVVELRTKGGLTQRQAAKAVGLSNGAVAAIDRAAKVKTTRKAAVAK